MEWIFRDAQMGDKLFILNANKEINSLSNLNDSIFSKNIEDDLFKNKHCFCIVCEIDHQLAGFLLYSYIYWANCGKGIYLSQAYVDSKFRKQGLLKELLKELEAREQQCHFITNLVGAENVVMAKALSHLNFVSSDLITYYRKRERD